MAFTAVHYPTDKDKDRIPYWSENEELGVAGENFFDQFVTFDASDPIVLSGGNLLEDPPSPSLLLDSLNDLTNSSSNDQSTRSGQSQSESSATSASLDIPFCSEPESLEQSKSVPAELTAPLVTDPVLSGGSISDSELLRLEGISLKSPKPNGTASSSPLFANKATPSPRKHSRVLDSIYATVRRVTHRSKPHKHHNPPVEASPVITMLDEFKREESTPFEMPPSFDLNGFSDVKIEEIPGPVDNHGLPVSPPLTGRIPPDHHSHDMMNFISGHLDDPFCDELLAPPAVINRAAKTHGPNSSPPTDTPGLSDDPFFPHGLDLMDTNGNSFRPRRQQPKLRSTSSAEWPMEGILTNDNNQDNLWSSSTPPDSGAPYVPDSGGAMPSPGWWDAPHQTNGHHHSRHSHNGNISHSHGHGHSNGLRNHAPLNLSMHGHHSDMSYEYHNGGDFSGLMIHMPQPRAPQAAVLSSSMSDSLPMSSPNSSYRPVPPSYHHPQGLHQHPVRHRRQYSEQRRPRPRAPSSGARHYSSSNGHYSTPLTSPRKVSSSSACYTLREETSSPTPGPRLRTSSSTSSLAVRKRRSWSRRQGEPRTPGRSSSSCRSASFGADGGVRRGSMSSGGGGSSSGGGGLSIEFCNYTPSDKKVLMNGVAPSGSSKTKARREREAQEHKRKMSEAYMQAIRAAGGDVEKLRQNGFFLNEQE
ncbi:hypothetical protein F5Y06DRAFT_101827 [Hypoxylon sp. FL0890]|nr:hypothetical protein F5Y06DRAFT_101827 [Hypoxylon sp. FL0890]